MHVTCRNPLAIHADTAIHVGIMTHNNQHEHVLQASFAGNNYYCTKNKPAEGLANPEATRMDSKGLQPIKTHYLVS